MCCSEDLLSQRRNLPPIIKINRIILILNSAVKADTVVPLPCRHLPRVKVARCQTDSGEGKKTDSGEGKAIDKRNTWVQPSPPLFPGRGTRLDNFSYHYHIMEPAQILISGGAPSWIHSSTVSWIEVSINQPHGDILFSPR